MKTSACTLGVIFAVLTGCSMTHSSKQDSVTRARNEIQGTWRVVALEADGKQAPVEIVAALKLVFKNDTLTFTPGEPGFSNYKYELDPTANPPLFVMTHADGPKQSQTETGIYLLEGDRLKICVGAGNTTPKEFTTKAKSGQGLYTLEREK